MLTRREAMLGAVGALKAPLPATKVSFDVPANACDCHTHIFADPAKFPLSPGRTYTPEPALAEDMAALHRALHIARVVIVTPSVYGTDNSATIYGVRARGRTARGIAVIAERTPERDLDALAAAGIRGIRLNLATAGPTDPREGRRRFQAAAAGMQNRGWHIQIYAGLPVVAGIKDLVLESPVPVVFDHFGGAQAALGVDQPGFADLVELVHSGKAYVKISGAYRASRLAPDYTDVVPLAKALIAANPDRVLWGTDWPHPDSSAGRERVSQPLPIDDGRLLNQLPAWAPDAATRKQILVDNPARLYGF